ncbi:MAG: lysophospholipase L1-like esterase [Polyangiales bacterium]
MRRYSLFHLALVFVLTALCIACGDDVESLDASADVALLDAGVSNALSNDAGGDASRGDTGASDSGASDSGNDAATEDASEGCLREGTPHVYLVGDSTTASDSGWGDSLSVYLGELEVTNAGRGGRSSKSFYEEGAFDAVREAMGPDDFVFVQFGHNDSKPEEYRRTEPGSAPDFAGTFRDFLELYVEEVRAAGATPILLTPVSRMTFSGDEHQRTHGDYALAVRRVAEDNDVVLLDLEARSHDEFQRLGEEETLRLYAEEPDRTHFPESKAFRVAEMVVELLSESSSPLRCFVERD